MILLSQIDLIKQQTDSRELRELSCYYISVFADLGDGQKEKCNFPFIYQGEEYYHCVEIADGRFCSTTPNYDDDPQGGICICEHLSTPWLDYRPHQCVI